PTLDVGVDLLDRSHVFPNETADVAIPRNRLGETASGASVVAEVREPVLVEPEVVPELVEDGDSDLQFQLCGVRKLLLERPAVDRQRVRLVPAAVVQPEEVGVVRVLVLDDDGDVLEAAGEVGRQRVERAPDVLLEAHQYRGWSGWRVAKTFTPSTAKANPPTCAKNATPPPDCGWVIPKPPSMSWKRNQTPRNQIAGISRMRKKKPRVIAVTTLARGSST